MRFTPPAEDGAAALDLQETEVEGSRQRLQARRATGVGPRVDDPVQRPHHPGRIGAAGAAEHAYPPVEVSLPQHLLGAPPDVVPRRAQPFAAPRQQRREAGEPDSGLARPVLERSLQRRERAGLVLPAPGGEELRRHRHPPAPGQRGRRVVAEVRRRDRDDEVAFAGLGGRGRRHGAGKVAERQGEVGREAGERLLQESVIGELRDPCRETGQLVSDRGRVAPGQVGADQLQLEQPRPGVIHLAARPTAGERQLARAAPVEAVVGQHRPVGPHHGGRAPGAATFQQPLGQDQMAVRDARLLGEDRRAGEIGVNLTEQARVLAAGGPQRRAQAGHRGGPAAAVERGRTRHVEQAGCVVAAPAWLLAAGERP